MHLWRRHPALHNALRVVGLLVAFVVMLYAKVAYNANQDFVMGEETYTHGEYRRYAALSASSNPTDRQTGHRRRLPEALWRGGGLWAALLSGVSSGAVMIGRRRLMAGQPRAEPIRKRCLVRSFSLRQGCVSRLHSVGPAAGGGIGDGECVEHRRILVMGG